MGRPSLKQIRIAEIIDAYEICVTRFGVDGATLERVAEEAGLPRPLIRHNVENREDLLNALVERFFDRSHVLTSQLVDGLPHQKGAEVLIDRLLDGKRGDAKTVLVAEALIGVAADRPYIARRLKAWVNGFIAAIAAVLHHQYQDASQEDVEAVAAGITGIYFNVDSLMMLGRNASKRAALRLVNSLQEQPMNIVSARQKMDTRLFLE